MREPNVRYCVYSVPWPFVTAPYWYEFLRSIKTRLASGRILTNAVITFLLCARVGSHLICLRLQLHHTSALIPYTSNVTLTVVFKLKCTAQNVGVRLLFVDVSVGDIVAFSWFFIEDASNRKDPPWHLNHQDESYVLGHGPMIHSQYAALCTITAHCLPLHTSISTGLHTLLPLDCEPADSRVSTVRLIGCFHCGRSHWSLPSLLLRTPCRHRLLLWTRQPSREACFSSLKLPESLDTPLLSC